VWDTSNTNLPWVGTSGTDSSFQAGDPLTFDDTSSNIRVNVSGAVVPGLITVSSDVNNYTFAASNGSSSIGSYTSATALVKTGGSTLTINGSNTFTGAIVINDGTVIARNSYAFGTGQIDLNNAILTTATGVTLGNAIQVSGSSTFNLGSGANTYAGSLSGSNAILGIAGGSPLTLTGGMSGYSGLLTAGSGSIEFLLNGNVGSAAADFNLGTGVSSLYPHNGNVTISLGSLAGGSSTSIGAATADSNPVVYALGGDNNSAVFSGQISGGSLVSVTKNGTGVQTLAGVCSYTGTTTVNAGTLLVSGTLSNTPVMVESGGTLAGAGVIGGSAGGAVTTASNGIISPGNNAGAGGALNIGNGLSLNQATLDFGLSNASTGGSNDKIVLNGGTLSMTGAQNLQFSYLNGNLTSGTYTLISGGTNTVLNGVSFTTNLPVGSRQSYVLATSAAGAGPAYLHLAVTGVPPASLIWSGTGGGNGIWDAETTSAWSGGATATFFPDDTVTFNDSSSNGNVTINGNVAPASVLVNNNKTAYTIGGTGAIGGSTVLTKSGTGTLTISGSNTYTGGTYLDAGSLVLANSTANTAGLGMGNVTFDGGTLVLAGYTSGNTYNTFNNNMIVPAGETGTLDVTQVGPNSSPYGVLEGTLTGSGTLNMSVYYGKSGVAGDWSGFDGQLNVTTPATGNFFFAASYGSPGMPNATISLGNNVTMLWQGTVNNPTTSVSIGALAGTSSSVLEGGNTGGRQVIWSVGGDNASTVFAGTIQEQGSSNITSLLKAGTGMWTLSGNCNYNGTTYVSSGGLAVSGTVNCVGAFTVNAGATFDLEGGTVTTPTLTLGPGVTCSAYGTLNTILINNGAVNVGNHDTLTISGSAVNNGTMTFTDGAALSITGTFINNGVLDLLTGSQTLPVNLVNYGTIINSSSVKILSTELSGSSLSVKIQSYTGHNYILQSATSTTNPNWQTVTTQAGTGSILTLTDPSGATGSAKFYRVGISP